MANTGANTRLSAQLLGSPSRPIWIGTRAGRDGVAHGEEDQERGRQDGDGDLDEAVAVDGGFHGGLRGWFRCLFYPIYHSRILWYNVV